MTRLVRCPGCGTLVSPGPRCYRCRRAAEKQYDAVRPAHHAVYRSAEWTRLSAEVRATASRCTWCLRPLAMAERVADHVIPLAERPDLALDRDNLAVSCRGCNTKRGRNARIVDPEAEAARIPISVGERMAAILAESER